MTFRPTPIALAIVLAVLARGASAQAPAAPHMPPAATATAAMQTSFSADAPVAPDATLTLTFLGPFPYGPGRFAVMVGGEDVTAQFELVSPGLLRGVFAGAPMPAGNTVLQVHGLGEGNEWALIAQAPLSVAPPAGGTRRALITPTVALQVIARPWESHSPLATPPVSAGDASATVQAGLNTDHGDDTWGLKTQFKLSAATDRADALQYPSLGGAARRVDLASYGVDAFVTHAAGTSRLALGHVEAGNHPLLATAIAHRGLVARQTLGERMDLMVSSQSSGPLLGFGNPTGLADPDNRFTLASLGAELLERPGGLRATLDYFNGDTAPFTSLGSVPPAPRQHSHGWGLRFSGETADKAWRGQLAWAKSLYDDFPITPPPTALRGQAHKIELAHDLVQGLPLWNDWPLTLTATARRERSAPRYQSLGAFGVTADQLKHHLALDATLGEFTAGLSHDTLNTNLDRLPSQPRRRTPEWGFKLGTPLAAWLAPQADDSLWPTVEVGLQRSHTWLDPSYAPNPSSPGGHDDVVTTTHSLALSWKLSPVTLNYTVSRVFDDDRRNPTQDSVNLDHTVAATWQVADTATLNLNLGWNPSSDLGALTQAHAKSAELSGQWGFGARYTLSAKAGYRLDRDNPLTDWRRVITHSLSLDQAFDLTWWGKRLPGQWTLSYQHQHTDAGTPSPLWRVRYESLHLGVSLSY